MSRSLSAHAPGATNPDPVPAGRGPGASRTDEPDYASVFAAAPTPYLLLDPQLTIVDANVAYLAAVGRTRDELVGQPLFDAFPDNPEDPDADGVRNLQASLERSRDTRQLDVMPGQRYDIPAPGSAPGPNRTFVERYWSPINVPVLDATGEVVLLLHRVIDVTAFVRRRRSPAQADVDTVPTPDSRELAEAEEDLFQRGQELGELNRQLQAARDELADRALRDPLTGLLVRSVLLEQLTQALARLRRQRGTLAVLFVDLDRFKQVNDTSGHAAGDELLRTFAARLRRAVRPSDVVARLGGDEFAVLLDGLPEDGAEEQASEVARRLLEDATVPCEVAPGQLVTPSASIGIALAGSGGPAVAADRSGNAVDASAVRGTADELLSQADAAMYRAKRSGRARVGVFDEVDYAAIASRRQVETDLRTALEGGELLLHYQPIIDLDAGGASAVEALLRWQHPQRGLLVAGTFIDVAEAAGLLPEIGAWVVTEAVRQLAVWDERLGRRAPGRLFLNLSAAELAQPWLQAHVAETAGAHGVQLDRLVLEVTESGVLEGTDAPKTLQAVRELGCELAIDDFGTGYSSLSRLVQLPAAFLKVDQSFVRALSRDQQSVAVIAAVLTLAHNLRKTVVAEGVEDEATLLTLRELGCTYAQGYHLGVPLPPTQLEETLR